jgi:4-hydroxybenzoate polyprenyltransferase
MSDVLRALGISAGILILVVVFIVLVSFAVVTRGEVGEADASREVPQSPVHVKETTTASPGAKPVKGTTRASEEISVPEILLYGTGLFVLSILALLALSLIQHMS